MKKQIFSTLVLSIGILLPFSLHSQEQRKKVGVVLSGGGAKGVAHIKALKVIEEAGIPIDYIVGTLIKLMLRRFVFSLGHGLVLMMYI